MKTIRISVAGAIVRFLQAQYTERDGRRQRLIEGVFGIFGHGNVTGLGQALDEHGATLPFYQAKNEQGGVHAAIAFAKTRRRLATLACTSSVGPGATNMVTGAATATINRLPVLLLPGDTFANRRPAPVLQQLESPQSMDLSVNDCFRPVSRFWDRINRPEQILSALPEAMRVLADPAETGAVTVALPEDVQAEAFDCPVSFFEERVHHVERRLPEEDRLRDALVLLRQARRPLIIAGGGVHYSDACVALRRWVDKVGIPVACTQAGKGSLPEDHPWSVGAVGVTGTACANALAREADLVLCLGTRLSDFTTASRTLFQHPEVRFVSVNVNAADAAKAGALALVGDVRAVLEKWIRARVSPAPRTRLARVARLKRDWEIRRHAMLQPAPSPDGLLYQSEVIGILNEAADASSTVVHAAGGIPGDIHKLWTCRGNTDYHSEYGYSCMGYEIAGALGVKLAAPDREVYALIGDGSYLMLSQELVTAVQERRKITVVLTDNHGFGCIHNLQRSRGGRSFGNTFQERNTKTGRLDGRIVPIDFSANAASLGAKTFSARTRAELQAALRQARDEAGVCFIYVPVTEGSVMEGFAWWDVPPVEHSRVSSVQRARIDYEKERRAWRQL